MTRKVSKKTLVTLFKTILKIRMVEEEIIRLYPEQEIKSPVHLCIGEEAISAGVCSALKKEDFVFSNHRGHGHYIANGGSLKELMAELYGKKTGCSKGKGGSMHLVDAGNGFMGSSAIVGGGIPIAVGAAMASVMQKKKRLSVVFFGDGAVDEGVFNESLNFAGLRNLPVIFVCENNFYATNSPQSARQPLDNIYKKGIIYGIPGIKIDGNDAVKVFEAADTAAEKARKGNGPALIECRTYRWKAHVGPDCDFETGCRPKYEHDEWLKRCPLKIITKTVLKKGILPFRDIERMQEELKREIDEAVLFAKSSPFPAKEELMEDVY